MKNLPVNSLRFDDIKQNLKDFLKGNSAYTDFNFEASGIGTLVNLLSYQTHYIGYFVKMLIDEAFVDSAHTKQGLLSHAKRVNYVPKGKKAATAQITLAVNTNLSDEPLSRSIEVTRGTTFNAANNALDNRVFSIIDGSVIYNRVVNGSNVTYVSEPLQVYEGEIREWKFKVDSNLTNQRFIIKDPDIDIDTIRVRVRENADATNAVEYSLASGISDIGGDSPVFFLSTDEYGNYQIFFGNGVFGIQPENGNAIDCSYVATTGEDGNGAKTFTLNPPTDGTLSDFNDFDVTTLSPSSGGREEETVEELRFAIPYHYRRQNRIFTEVDCRSILLADFRNIDSMNVWGGEKNTRKDYGKVYVSIKPKNADRLTALAKQSIREAIIQKYGFIGIDVVFVEPEFIDVELSIYAKVDMRKTSKTLPELTNEVKANIQAYNQESLSRFDNMLSDIDMLNKIDDEAFVSLYSKKVLNKTQAHLHNSSSSQDVFFGNGLIPGTINSGIIVLAGVNYTIRDNDGILYLATGPTLTTSKVGTIDYNTGLINYTLPAAARILGYELNTYGQLKFSAQPATPDIFTYLNNIVRISQVKVIAS